MKTIKLSGQFKKDMKRYAHSETKKRKLFEIVECLKQGLPIPAVNKPHKLKGRYSKCMECHVEDDFLLIWFDEDSQTVTLFRLDTHSELFK